MLVWKIDNTIKYFAKFLINVKSWLIAPVPSFFDLILKDAFLLRVYWLLSRFNRRRHHHLHIRRHLHNRLVAKYPVSSILFWKFCVILIICLCLLFVEWRAWFNRRRHHLHIHRHLHNRLRHLHKLHHLRKPTARSFQLFFSCRFQDPNAGRNYQLRKPVTKKSRRLV